jgi:hypothetical protein
VSSNWTSVPCCIAAVLVVCPWTAQTQGSKTGFIKQLSSYDVAWNEPGKGSADSMPLGNGEIGLNVWTEPSGNLLFYIGVTPLMVQNCTPSPPNQKTPFRDGFTR